MFKKLWDAFCLTMGVSTKEGDGEPVDRWAAQRELAERLEAERREKRRESLPDVEESDAPESGTRNRKPDASVGD